MQFDGAVVREQGVTFAVVVVKPQVLQDQSASQRAAASFQPYFPGVPVVLMAQGAGGRSTYWGRRDIVNFLSHVPVGAIPWKRYAVH